MRNGRTVHSIRNKAVRRCTSASGILHRHNSWHGTRYSYLVKCVKALLTPSQTFENAQLVTRSGFIIIIGGVYI